MGFLSRIWKYVGFSTVLFFAVLIGPNFLPPGSTFTEFHVAPAKYPGEELEVFRNVERLFEGEIKGPEAFEVVNGVLYTTLHGGYVAKVFEDQIIPAVKFGEPCEGWWEEKQCGRPLGLKVFEDRYLIVADAYFGIFRFDIRTGQVTKLVDKDAIIEGRKPRIFNSVEVAKDGTVYWTHSSSDFTLEDGIFAFLSDGTGRLLKYDPKTGTNVVLMKDLYFANGVVLSADEDFLLVAESGHSRIHRYYLKGPKQSTSEIFIDGLPGMPDNLRRRTENDFLVPLVFSRDENHPALFQVISPFPMIRKFLARILTIIEIAFEKIHSIYPSYYTKRAVHYVGHLESVTAFLPAKTTVLVIDVNGNIVRNYVGYDGSVSAVSDVIAHRNYLYFGSPTNTYLGRMKLSLLDEKLAKTYTPSPRPQTPQSVPKSTPPPETTKSIPTSAPPPPSTKPTTTTRPPPPPTTPSPKAAKPTTTTRPPPPPPPTTTTSAPTTTKAPTTTTTSRPPSPRTTSSPSTTTPKPQTTAKPVTAAPTPKPSPNLKEEPQRKP